MAQPDRPLNRLMTVGEVAELFAVDPKTVTRWAKAGRLTAVRTPGGHHRFRLRDVQALYESLNPGGSVTTDA